MSSSKRSERILHIVNLKEFFLQKNEKRKEIRLWKLHSTFVQLRFDIVSSSTVCSTYQRVKSVVNWEIVRARAGARAHLIIIKQVES